MHQEINWQAVEYDEVPVVNEIFTYDNLNRLESQTEDGGNSMSVDFDVNGYILEKTDAGTNYLYDLVICKVHS